MVRWQLPHEARTKPLSGATVVPFLILLLGASTRLPIHYDTTTNKQVRHCQVEEEVKCWSFRSMVATILYAINHSSSKQNSTVVEYLLLFGCRFNLNSTNSRCSEVYRGFTQLSRCSVFKSVGKFCTTDSKNKGRWCSTLPKLKTSLCSSRNFWPLNKALKESRLKSDAAVQQTKELLR